MVTINQFQKNYFLKGENMFFNKFFSVFTVLIVTISLAQAGEGMTPEKIDGVKKVTAEEAMKLCKEGAVFVDPRKKIEWKEEHIVCNGAEAVYAKFKTKSENKPDFDQSKDKLDVSAIPKGKKLVFYCNGVKCWKSFKALSIVSKAGGYEGSNLYWFRGGIPEWKSKGFPTSKK